MPGLGVGSLSEGLFRTAESARLSICVAAGVVERPGAGSRVMEISVVLSSGETLIVVASERRSLEVVRDRLLLFEPRGGDDVCWDGFVTAVEGGRRPVEVAILRVGDRPLSPSLAETEVRTVSSTGIRWLHRSCVPRTQ